MFSKYIGRVAVMAGLWAIIAWSAAFRCAFALPPPGDVDGSGAATLRDAVVALQVAAGSDLEVERFADVDDDRKIGLAEAVYILQVVSGLQGEWGPDRIVFDVEWTPETTVVSESMLGLMKSADTTDDVYVFDAAGVGAAGLDLSEGRILVIYNTAFGKIDSVVQNGPDLEIHTVFAPLTEAISDGTIAWDYGVEFTADKIVGRSPDGRRIRPRADELTFSFPYGGFTFDIKMGLGGATSAVTITAKKGIGDNITAQFTAQGTLHRFRSQDLIEIRSRKLEAFEHSLDGIRGDLTLELLVAGSASDSLNFKPDLTLMEIPIPMMIPTTLAIKIQFVSQLKVPIDGSTNIKTGFSFDSDLGVVFNGVDVSANAQIGPYQFADESKTIGASSPVAANFGIGFPRFELGIGKVLIVPWAQTAFLIGGSFTPFHPTCLIVEGQFIGAGGVDFAVLGELLNRDFTFWNEKETFFRSNTCP